MIPYEFDRPPDGRRDWREVPKKERPHTPIIDLHGLLRHELEEVGWDSSAEEILSRTAKTRLFRALWPGTPVYRRDGWAFDFRPALLRYVILAGPSGVHLAYAPDKRCLREQSHFYSIEGIYRIKNEIAEEYRSCREKTAKASG